MVLDKLINPQLLHNKPYLAVPTGVFFVLLAFFSAGIVFPGEYSIAVIAFASMLALPYVMKVFELDELNIDLSELKVSGELKRAELEAWARKCLRDGYTPNQIKRSLIENNLDKDIKLLNDLGILDEIHDKYLKESTFFSRHAKAVEFYCNLFLGMFIAFFMISAFSNQEFREVVFKHQLEFIYGARGSFSLPTVFYAIVSNNLKIVLLCVFLSLLYGSGAILILAYNASFAGVLYGSFVRNFFLGYSLKIMVSYLPHTTIEILAYLLAAVSGSILSKAFIEVEPGSQRLLLSDGGKFLMLSIALVLLAGFVEVTAPSFLITLLTRLSS